MARSSTGNPIVTAALTELAALRQAPNIDEETLDLFSARIAEDGLDVDLVVDACHELARMERGEGESAFPSYGTLLREYHAAEYRRHRRRQLALAAEGERYLRRADEDNEAVDASREEARLIWGDFKRVVAERRRQKTEKGA